MTTHLRGLVVDDNPDVAEMVKKSVAYGFKKIGWEIDWATAHTVLDADELLQRERPFHVAIVDYRLEERNLGSTVVRDLRTRAPLCYILVVTSEGERYPDFRERSKEAGANDAIMRPSLTLTAPAAADPHSWDVQTLARRIRRHLTVGGLIGAPAITFAASAEIQSMLHSLGEPPDADGDASVRGERIARSLILDCLESDDDAPATLVVEHLAPGRSGAHVCKVLREQEGRPLQSFVVKMSLNHAALEAEREASREATRALGPQMLVDYSGHLRKDTWSGYAALVARLADDVVTLRSWLTTAPAAAAVKVADELFLGQLSALFQANLREPRQTKEWLKLSPIRTLRVHDTVAMYTEVWRHDQGAGIGNAGELAAALLRFVDDGTLPGVDVPPTDDSVTYVHGFGDLHATNILVRTAGRPGPVLIDASAYGPQHWAGDAARLLVDLVLQVRRTGVDAMLWTSVAADAPYAGGLCGCAGAGAGDPADPVDAFVGQVIARRDTYLHLADLRLREAAWHWQWHVALAREFLRQGSRPGLMPPTAVLALAAAAGQLERAAAALRT